MGVEAAPFCVAKTAVLLRMLASGGADAHEAVFQAWYCAGWGVRTHELFREAARSLLNDPAADQAATPFLRCWASWPPVPLKAARASWMGGQTEAVGKDIGCFSSRDDRMALCRYHLSGDLPQADGECWRPAVGSLAMFALPRSAAAAGAAPVADQCALHALRPAALWRLRASPGGPADVVAAAAALLRARVASLAARLATAPGAAGPDATVRLVCARVAPGERVVRAVRALDAASVSWSNVCECVSRPHKRVTARNIS